MDQMEAMPALPREPPWREFARAPLAPIALGTAAGLALERFAALPLEVYFAVAAIGLIFWATARQRSSLSTLFLGFAFAGPSVE